MSAHSENEYQQLFMAHANRELEPEGVAQLEAMVGQDSGRQRDLRELDQLHGWLDGERELRAAVMAPPEPREDSSEVFQKLTRRAARTEQALRTMASDGLVEPVVAARPILTFRRVAGLVAAAVILVGVSAALGLFSGEQAPPKNIVLNEMMPIVLEPELTAKSRSFSWHAVVGVAHYDCVIVDGENRPVVERAEQYARSTVWELTEAEYDRLANHVGPLFLRVAGFDGVGFQLASTGDLELSVR